MSHQFPYIKDPVLFRAVNFATKMVGDGRGLDKAAEIAAGYYKIDKWLVSDQLKLRGLKEKETDEGYSAKINREGPAGDVYGLDPNKASPAREKEFDRMIYENHSRRTGAESAI